MLAEAGELIALGTLPTPPLVHTADGTRRVGETLGLQGLVAVPTYLLHQMWE